MKKKVYKWDTNIYNIFQGEINYDPGDHVGIMACNRKELVDSLLARLKDIDNYDEPLQLQLMKETHTSSGEQILIIYCLQLFKCIV